MGGFLKRLGLETPAQRAWAMYDWGNSAFITVIVTAIFPIYYQTVVAADLEPAQATARFSYVTSGALVVVALLSPLLGALADARAWRKRFLDRLARHRRARDGGDGLGRRRRLASGPRRSSPLATSPSC